MNDSSLEVNLQCKQFNALKSLPGSNKAVLHKMSKILKLTFLTTTKYAKLDNLGPSPIYGGLFISSEDHFRPMNNWSVGSVWLSLR